MNYQILGLCRRGITNFPKWPCFSTNDDHYDHREKCKMVEIHNVEVAEMISKWRYSDWWERDGASKWSRLVRHAILLIPILIPLTNLLQLLTSSFFSFLNVLIRTLHLLVEILLLSTSFTHQASCRLRTRDEKMSQAKVLLLRTSFDSLRF